MIVTETPGTLELPRDYTRSPGVHLSSIIRCLAIDMGILTDEQAEELQLVDVRHILDPVALLRISIGLAWEDYYIGRVLSQEGVTNHPGEMLADGVYMTPDGESVDVIITEGKCGKEGIGSYVEYPIVHRIHEIKATYKSTNTVGNTADDLQKQWMWMAQLMGYCRAAKTRHAKLHVLFICGDYKMPITPQLKVFDIEFTEVELFNNWTLIQEGKEHYGSAS